MKSKVCRVRLAALGSPRAPQRPLSAPPGEAQAGRSLRMVALLPNRQKRRKEKQKTLPVESLECHAPGNEQPVQGLSCDPRVAHRMAVQGP